MLNVRQKGNLIMSVLSLVPVVFWLMDSPVIPRFSGFIQISTSLGQIFGLVGAAMFAANLLISARLPIFEKLFNGLNRLYRSHNVFGKLSLVLLLMHPLSLIPMYSGGTWEGAKAFLLPSYSTAVAYGWYALVLMVVLIFITIWLRPRYNIWKWTHKFLGFSFFLASLHVYFIPSTTTLNMGLRWYMLGLSVISLVAFMYRSVLGKWLVPRTKYKVKSVVALNQTVVRVDMEPIGKVLPFVPGQFIFISFEDGGVSSEVHPFSIASSVEDGVLSIIVKNLGDYTSKLPSLKAGATASIEGPYGVFSYKNSQYKKEVWLAGGIGVTPFLSMVGDLRPGDGYDVSMYYCVKEEVECVSLDLLKKAETVMQGAFKWKPFCSSVKGFMNVDLLHQELGDLSGRDYFLCAPPVMIESLRSQLLAKGVALANIHSEEFNF